MINKVTLIGRLTKDPEVKYLQQGYAVAQITLAVERNYKGKDGERETDFFPVVIWRKSAEVVEKYACKGSMLGVAGRLQTRTYDAADGTKRYITEIVAEEVQLFGGKTGEKTKAPLDKDNVSYGQPFEGFEEINDLNVPF